MSRSSIYKMDNDKFLADRNKLGVDIKTHDPTNDETPRADTSNNDNINGN